MFQKNLEDLCSIIKDAQAAGVIPAFFHWVLVDKQIGLINCAELNGTKKTILQMAELLQTHIDDGKVEKDDWKKAIVEYPDMSLTHNNSASNYAALEADKRAYKAVEEIVDYYCNADCFESVMCNAVSAKRWHYAAFADGYEETYSSSYASAQAAIEVVRFSPFVKTNAIRAYEKKLLELIEETKND